MAHTTLSNFTDTSNRLGGLDDDSALARALSWPQLNLVSVGHGILSDLAVTLLSQTILSCLM
jgi:hypothetical protein